MPFRVSRDGQPLRAGEVTVRNGQGAARFTDRVTAGGAHRYQVRLTPAVDARAGNNQAENWTEIVGGPRLLLVTNYPDDPAAGALRAQGFDVQAVTDLRDAQRGQPDGHARRHSQQRARRTSCRRISSPRSTSTCACRAAAC